MFYVNGSCPKHLYLRACKGWADSDRPCVATSYEVSQNPAMQSKLGYRVLCPGCGVVNSAGLAFKMCFGVITRHGFNAPLKFSTVFPQVMPQPCEKAPIRTPKSFSKFCSTFSNFPQMFLQLVDLKRTVIPFANMREVLF